MADSRSRSSARLTSSSASPIRSSLNPPAPLRADAIGISPDSAVSLADSPSVDGLGAGGLGHGGPALTGTAVGGSSHGGAAWPGAAAAGATLSGSSHGGAAWAGPGLAGPGSPARLTGSSPRRSWPPGCRRSIGRPGLDRRVPSAGPGSAGRQLRAGLGLGPAAAPGPAPALAGPAVGRLGLVRQLPRRPGLGRPGLAGGLGQPRRRPPRASRTRSARSWPERRVLAPVSRARRSPVPPTRNRRSATAGRRPSSCRLKRLGRPGAARAPRSRPARRRR